MTAPWPPQTQADADAWLATIPARPSRPLSEDELAEEMRLEQIAEARAHERRYGNADWREERWTA